MRYLTGLHLPRWAEFPEACAGVGRTTGDEAGAGAVAWVGAGVDDWVQAAAGGQDLALGVTGAGSADVAWIRAMDEEEP